MELCSYARGGSVVHKIYSLTNKGDGVPYEINIYIDGSAIYLKDVRYRRIHTLTTVGMKAVEMYKCTKYMGNRSTALRQ